MRKQRAKEQKDRQNVLKGRTREVHGSPKAISTLVMLFSLRSCVSSGSYPVTKKLGFKTE
jgi:hypothetical protein